MGNLHREYADLVDTGKCDRIPFELCHLAKDPSETTGLYAKYPEKVEKLKVLMETLKEMEHQIQPIANPDCESRRENLTSAKLLNVR